MGCLTKTLGRLLFVTILVSSAYLHLNRPETYTQEFQDNYTQTLACAGKHLPQVSLPPAQAINWVLWVKVLGLFEGLTALLIVFGDCWGGFFLFMNLLVTGLFDYQDICSALQWETSRQLEFARYITFVGASLILMSCSKSCKKACPVASTKPVGKEQPVASE